MDASEQFQEGKPSSKRPESESHHRRPRRRREMEEEDDDDDYSGSGEEAVSTIIPYKNPQALIAYYLGVFGLIPGIGALLGPAALVLGIRGLRYVKREP